MNLQKNVMNSLILELKSTSFCIPDYNMASDIYFKALSQTKETLILHYSNPSPFFGCRGSNEMSTVSKCKWGHLKRSSTVPEKNTLETVLMLDLRWQMFPFQISKLSGCCEQAKKYIFPSAPQQLPVLSRFDFFISCLVARDCRKSGSHLNRKVKLHDNSMAVSANGTQLLKHEQSLFLKYLGSKFYDSN